MNIYVAGRYSRRDEFREVALRLISAGHHVTSRWLQEENPLNTCMGDDTEEFYRETALIDLEDIDDADCLLLYSEDPKVGIPRGGRQVEFGFALGRWYSLFRQDLKTVYSGSDKRRVIAIIGPKENIFHYLPGMRHFNSLDAFIAFAEEFDSL